MTDASRSWRTGFPSGMVHSRRSTPPLIVLSRGLVTPTREHTCIPVGPSMVLPDANAAKPFWLKSGSRYF